MLVPIALVIIFILAVLGIALYNYVRFERNLVARLQYSSVAEKMAQAAAYEASNWYNCKALYLKGLDKNNPVDRFVLAPVIEGNVNSLTISLTANELKSFALIAGLSVMPMAIALFVVSPRSVTLARRYGTRRTLMAGMFTLSAGLALLACCTRLTPYPMYGAILVLIGVGSALSNPLLSIAIIASLPSNQAGVGTGINSFTREIGGAFGVALFGSLLNAAYVQRLPELVGPQVGSGIGPAGRAIGSTLAALRQHAAQAPQLEALAKDSFTDAMGFALLVVAALLLLGSIPVILWIREVVRTPKASAN